MLFLVLASCNRRPKEVLAENEFYVCSMDPQVMEKQPGLCPICKMDLTKTTIDKSEMNLIKLSNEQINLGNIKTDTVRTDSIWEEKTLTGTFAVNQNLVQQVSSRFNGRIEKLYYKIPGQEIKEGDLIYEVYSRDLMLAEEEFISGANESVVSSAKNRLLIWGLTEKQIEQLARDKKAQIVNPIYSKVSGTITEIPYKEGDYIDEGSTVFKLADLSSLWVEAQIYSSDLGMLGTGDKVQVITEAFPEEIIDGTVEFANPELQPGSKINIVRVKVPNAHRKFIPGMMAYVILKSKPHPSITLPVDAVLQSQKFSHAWIRNADGSFEARKVQTGIQTSSKIEIISGLKEGDVVVVTGAYLLYSDYVFKKGAYPLTGINNKAKMDSTNNMNNHGHTNH